MGVVSVLATVAVVSLGPNVNEITKSRSCVITLTCRAASSAESGFGEQIILYATSSRGSVIGLFPTSAMYLCDS
jgi:hypothetical protein